MMSMKAAILIASLAFAEAGSLKLSWSDCGAAHGKVTGLSPDALTLGQTTRVTGQGNVNEVVSGGTFEIGLKASIISQTFNGDLCSSKAFSLPLGTGSITWAGMKCPMAAGSIDVPVDIKLSSHLPGALQNVEMIIKGKDTTGADIFCMKVDTSPALELSAKSDDYEEWAAFKQKYGKTYSTAVEEEERFQIFKVNLDYIKSMNSMGGNGFELGLTPFADLSADEFGKSHFGIAKPDALWASLPNLGSHVYKGEELATSIDWTAKGAVTAVKDQGQCGSCWSFSATGSLEGAMQIASGKLVSLSEQQFVDCDNDDSGCNGGLMDTAFEFAEKNAICTEASYPYKGVDNTCDASHCTVGIPKGGVTGFKDVDENSEEDLMSALNQQPVSIAIEADELVFQHYKTGVLSGACGSNLDHGVLAVGYGIENGTKYWLVKNSWGESWGENGYVKLLRGKGGAGECGLLKMASYPVVTTSPSPTPTPTPSGPVGSGRKLNANITIV